MITMINLHIQTSIMADEISRRFPALNMLVCNAGVLQPRRTESKDGLEVTFQVEGRLEGYGRKYSIPD